MYPQSYQQSRRLHERARAYMPGGNTRSTLYMKPFPVYAARGQGCRIWDVDGKEFIDCGANFTALIHGHAHPALVKAASDQLILGTAFGMSTESEIELAELLADRLHSVDQIRFANSGTEAVMTALKAARAYTGRFKIAKCEGAYHGAYDYVEVSLDTSPDQWTANAPLSTPYAKGTPPAVLNDTLIIPFNDIDGAVSLLREHGHELACVLVDPMPNRAGLVPAERGYLEALRAVTREIGALLIFDEVISFRLGHSGAQGIWDVKPDLTALGKILGGGFPVGAIGGSVEVMAVFDPSNGKPALPHAGTFAANPMTMRAGFAAMQLLDMSAFARLDALGERLRAGIETAFRRLRIPGHVAGRGSLFRIHFGDQTVRDYRSAYMNPAAVKRMAAFTLALLDRGVLAPSGLLALSTPMTVDDIDAIIRSIAEAIAVATTAQ
jgi:glutamate-1-semialdehyde 2,1-aminomutase